MKFLLTSLLVLSAFSIFEIKFVLSEKLLATYHDEHSQTGWKRFLNKLSKLIHNERSKLEKNEKHHGHNGVKLRTTTTTTQEPPCCTPSPIGEPCRDGACVPGHSPALVYWPVCVNGICVCITPADVCDKTVSCCDGSACPKTKVCPPAPLNGLCEYGRDNQCAVGFCQIGAGVPPPAPGKLLGKCQI